MRKMMMMAVAALLMAAPANAQTDNAEGLGSTVNGLITKAKQGMKRGSKRVKEEWNGDGLVEIDGHKYMTLHTKDVYQGAEATSMKEACQKAFQKKYPTVSIVSVAMPDADWVETTTRSLGKISKYVKTLSCYVVAQDGADGFINARFTFRLTKKVGKTWMEDTANWPLWERTDVLTPDVYQQLKKKK